MISEEMDTDFLKAIDARWPTPADFYRERDDRTLRDSPELTAYADRPIEILVSASTADSLATQQTALVACNLAARWARNIKVIMPAETQIARRLDRKTFVYLRERIQTEMRSADPFGNFEIVSTDSYSGATGALRLFVGDRGGGSELIPIDEDDFLVSSTGEYAIGRRGESFSANGLRPGFAPATALAASIGVADLFKRAIGHPKEHWIGSFNWNLIDHAMHEAIGPSDESFAEHLDIGNVLLAGAGAIGSSLAYLLDLEGVTGKVTLLDRDRVETSNLNRSLVFDVSHVLSNTTKTGLIEKFLQPSVLSAARLDGTWREHSASVAAGNYDVWISFTNEDAAWAELPFQLPPVVIQGTTTSGWGFGAGRHIPRKEDCTLCRMPRPEAEFRGPCAAGEIEPVGTEAPIRASLPFLSVASAALVFAELLKVALPDVQHLPNEVSADLKTGLAAVVSLKRLANPNCRGCRILQSDLWQKRGGRGRYSRLSV